MTSNHGKILAILFSALIVAGAIFFGLRYLSEWHEREIQSALELQRNRLEERQTGLAREIRRLEKQLEEKRKEEAAPDRRDAEVFGETPEDVEEIDRCAFLENRINSFFAYIDDKMALEKSSARGIFFSMMEDLEKNPPLVVGETRDLITLLRNRAHFFRVLKKERIDMVRHVLQAERDILESAMADFFAYYIGEEQCIGESGETLMDLEALYDYAGFFLESISGKSYLMRRDSSTRVLSLYYSIRILDKAIDKGINRYGIDIREHIDAAMDDIRHRGDLRLRDHYMEQLRQLEEKHGL